MNEDQVLQIWDSIEVGDLVRSYDFEGNDSCYVEGVVEDQPFKMGCQRYKIKCLKRIFQGEEVHNHEDYYFPPANGTPIAWSFSGKKYADYVSKVIK